MQILKMIYDLYPSDLASVADGFGGAQARGEGSDDEEKQRLCSGTRHCILRCWKLGAALLVDTNNRCVHISESSSSTSEALLAP
jgi:hypothetical protein